MLEAFEDHGPVGAGGAVSSRNCSRSTVVKLRAWAAFAGCPRWAGRGPTRWGRPHPRVPPESRSGGSGPRRGRGCPPWPRGPVVTESGQLQHQHLRSVSPERRLPPGPRGRSTPRQTLEGLLLDPLRGARRLLLLDGRGFLRRAGMGARDQDEGRGGRADAAPGRGRGRSRLGRREGWSGGVRRGVRPERHAARARGGWGRRRESAIAGRISTRKPSASAHDPGNRPRREVGRDKNRRCI